MTICLCLLFAGRASARRVISDPGNLIQDVISASKSIIHTSKAATNIVSSFQEMVEIYQQGKKYYDAFKSVNNLVKDTRKVQQTILMVGSIIDIYVNNFQRMLRDRNFGPEGLSATAFGYAKPLEKGNGVLTKPRNVVNVTTLSMIDKECIGVVERCHSRIKRYRSLVSYYTNKNIPVSCLCAKKKDDLDRVMRLYGNMNGRYWWPTRFDNLHQILRSLYEQMMPLCGDMAGVARGIAGLGALFYVAYRVWQSLARTKPTGVFPMLRPFTIGLCIMFFPAVVLGTINSTLSSVVQGTAKMPEAETLDMNRYREQKNKLEHKAMARNPEIAYLMSNEEFDEQLEELGWSPSDIVAITEMYIDRGMYNMKRNIRNLFHEILELLFQAATLVVSTARTFSFMVLATLGPIVFALSVRDGFQNTLTQRICRYVQIYLWLPVSDMFSTILAKIQVLILRNDIERMQAGPDFSLDSSDGVYIVFLCIDTIGYFTIPTVAGWIIQAGDMGDYGRNVNQMAERAGSMAGSVADAAAGSAVGRVGKLLK